MKKIALFIIILHLFASLPIVAQKRAKTDANIVGHITSAGSHLSSVTVALKGTTIGTVSDETGHYRLLDLPLGKQTMVATLIGYKPKELLVNIEPNKTLEINFDLEEDAMKLEEVVVSGDRNDKRRNETSVILNTIIPKLFSSTQSVTLSEGLNFCPGLRLENDCQNCGFTQVRMNGMEGPYSQILINNRPIFSGLAGVYGLEMIPANMIERVEVVRGGGSALFGSNAIAGTINLILKDPVSNSYEVGAVSGMTGVGVDGKAANDYSLNFNTSLVSADNKTGVAVYGFSRDKQMFDTNNDGFSEIAPSNNLTLGSRFFQRLGDRGKIAIDFFNIKEERDGGNMQDYSIHERDIAESLKHDLKTGAFTYDQYLREGDKLSVYASGQDVKRNSYYGANKSLESYGHTKDFTYNIGVQYKAIFGDFSLVGGLENTTATLKDTKLGHPVYAVENGEIITSHTENALLANQESAVTGLFGQAEQKWGKIRITLGARFDHYLILDKQKANSDKKGNVLSPRISLMYDILKELQARVTYSQGYRAPQIFDEDLHIESSSMRRVINVNDPNLKQETSRSYMASLDFNKKIGGVNTGLLIEGFYTSLLNPFFNEIGKPNAQGVVLYTRKNAESGAYVAGVNFEFKLKPTKEFSLTSGYTIQASRYNKAEPQFNQKRYFRTPENYGFFSIDWDILKSVCLSSNANYTGAMLVPYFGPKTNQETGELRQSAPFFDLGAKLQYTMKLNSATLQWFAGVKNLFNSYQTDFDLNKDRDPSYIYGPNSPRSIYVGFKIGNFLK